MASHFFAGCSGYCRNGDLMKNTIHQIIQETIKPRAILVGLNVNRSDLEFERSMNELKELTDGSSSDIPEVTEDE